MNILALDTAGAACSVAVLRGVVVAASRSEPMARGHSEALMPMIRAAMRDAALEFDALDLIAATVGPGAFTGIRIGLAAARGLALAAGKPAVGVTSFEAVAEGV